ncbi:MAG TPA: 2-oxoglutarate dehydrogenase, E2 component, dihydrolipoamide succinyltransferase [Candidatus Limnocylindrales bacterium]|nr:2-oxoglutarate dehydrogenase, E2 component, dihydrolipoamide succinyltransferase [Candidatus Limnocylindrales bacterium]
MAVDVIMPQMGESIFEGTITKWLKKPGDKIERDEPLFEISTDKVDAEIPSPAAGVLKEIKVNEGQTVPIQTVVAVIDADGSGAATAAPAPAKADAPKPAPAPAAAKAAAPPPPSPAPRPTLVPPAGSPGAAQRPSAAAGAEKVRSSPLVRRMAREHNIDLSQVSGTGAGGRVSKRDILGAIESGGARPAAPPVSGVGGAPASVALEAGVPREKMYFGHYEVQPMSVMRQRIAEHMVMSKRVSPHVYSVDEVDVTGIARLRAQMKEKFEQASGTKLTFMPFFVRAAAEALRAFPTVNSSVDGTNVVLHKECNIGIAVALDWGLIVPVIKNAEEKNFLGIARAINDLAERARTKKLKPEEVAESTFSITNPGVFGGLFGLPVINQPNVAILGLGTIEKRPVVIDDAIAIRSMVYLTLSYDHRIVDGAVAHQFMRKIKLTLENWTESIL